MIAAIVFVFFVAFALICVSIFGFILGPIVWLLVYGLFLAIGRTALRYFEP